MSTYYVRAPKLEVRIITMNKTSTASALMEFSVQLGMWTIKYTQ